ncbi:MAG: RNA polymerase sigma factor region1.1 domain-containing protein, partial [Acidobacteriota bacterium]
MLINGKFKHIEEKYDGVRELINLGKERGYLLYDKINDALRDHIDSSKDLDSIFDLFGDEGIEVIDSKQQLEAVKRKTRSKSTDEDEEDQPDPAAE